MTAWSPTEAGVQQICHLLAEIQKPGTDQAQVLSQLEHCTRIPDFNNYLAYIFADGENLSIEVRQSAGLLLKNNLKNHYAGATEELRQYIKVVLLHTIANPSKPLRQTGGTSVAVIVGVGGLQNWPELIATFTSCLESNDKNSLEGALDALYKISEDVPAQLEAEISGRRCSDALVPRLLALFKSEHQEAKCLAIAIMNILAVRMPQILDDQLDLYVKGLFSLAYDPSGDVRRVVCTGLVQMLHLQQQRLQPHMKEIIEYMLQATQDGDEGVALESCEFWSAFCEAAVDAGLLRPFLSRLIPVLLKNMVYDEYDEEVSEAEAAEEAGIAGVSIAEDRDQDVRPFLPKSSGGHGHSETDSESDGEEVNRWNLRKCSAAGLDVLSTVFEDELLPIVTPIVQQRLQSSVQEEDWRARESAILALGAISEGCAKGLLPFLAEMVGMLLPKLSDSRPLVRSITCWALSRYSHWLVQAAAQSIPLAQQQLDTVLKGVLERALDHNKHVQEAACSALATMAEEAGAALSPHLKDILQILGKAATSYSRKNLRILYDALSTLADGVGPSMGQPELLRLFMPPLVAKWQQFQDSDRELMPLMEAFTSLVTALGPAFQEFVGMCYERCERIVSNQLQARNATASGQATTQEYSWQFVVCSLDLISGLADGIGPPLSAMVTRGQLNTLLPQCCKDDSADVRQSAFALVGDLAKICAHHIGPAAPQLLQLAMKQLEPAAITQEAISACNNACWSLGELVVKSQPNDIAPFATSIAERLVPILAAPTGSMPRSILENCAITLGRVAWICPGLLAPHLQLFVGVWCSALRNIRDNVEKEHAFLGLTSLLRLNPQGAVQAFSPLCEAITSWQHIQCEGLANEIVQLLQLYKQNFKQANQWETALQSLQPAVRGKLVAMCHL